MEEKKVQTNGDTKASHSKWKAFLTYVKYIFTDFFTSFKYNKMKLPGFLVAIPGVFLGFLLVFHVPVVNALSFTESGWANGAKYETVYFPDISAILLFILVLFGILNLFTAFNMMSKKNLGSVITATVTSAFIVIAGAIYIFMIFYYVQLVQSGVVKLANNATFTWSTNYIVSVASTIISMVGSIAGVILGFIFYDRNYKKVVF